MESPLASSPLRSLTFDALFEHCESVVETFEALDTDYKEFAAVHCEQRSARPRSAVPHPWRPDRDHGSIC